MLGLRLEDFGTGFQRNMLEKVFNEICMLDDVVVF